jgi:hypothetical protein
MTLQLHKPDGKGGLEKRSGNDGDWRDDLRSPRWGSALRAKRVPKLSNPEMNPTSTLISVLFWVGLGVLTLLLLVAGYGTGFWKLG